MGVAVFPPCQLFGLRYPSTGAYKLLDEARFQCQGPKMSASSQSSHSSPVCLPPDFITTESLSCPFPSQEIQQYQQVGLAPGFGGVTACSVTQCAQDLCVHPPRVESLFPSLWNSAVKPCQPSKPEVLRLPWCQAPRLGAWHGTQSLYSVGKCLHYNYSPACGLPIQMVWVWLYRESTLPAISLFLLYVFVEYLLGRFQSFFFLGWLFISYSWFWCPYEEVSLRPPTLPSYSINNNTVST